MIRVGEMVRAGGPPMKLVSLHGTTAICIVINHAGQVRFRYHDVDQLKPLWLTLQPKSLWPEFGNLDAVAILKEENAARAARKAERRASKKTKRRSNKIKRRTPA